MNVNFRIKIISLKDDVDRRNHVFSQLRRLGLADQCDVINAVDGKKLNKLILDEINVNKQYHSETGHSSNLTPSEIGCLLSHLSVYKSMKEGDVMLVLEDDIDINENILPFLYSVDLLPLNWELILLGHQVERSRPTYISLWGRKACGGSILGKPVEFACGTYGYLINFRGARKLIDRLGVISAPIDHYTGVTSVINLYALKKPLVDFSRDPKYVSNIASDRTVQNDVSMADSLFKRFIKRVLARINLLGLAKFLINNFRYRINKIKVLKRVRRYSS